MTPNFARFLVGVMVALAVAATWSVANAADYKTAPGPLKTICETNVQRERDVRLGPNGVEYVIPPPKCTQVRMGRSPTFHVDGRTLIPSQQSVPEGSACLRTITIDHFVYGQTAEGGSLWALCSPR